MKKHPLLILKEQLKFSTVAKRRIRIKETTFSFHIYDLCGSLGLDFVEILRDHKQLLGLTVSKWALPKLIRILVENVGESEDLEFKIIDEINYFDIRIELENLYDLELLCENRKDFCIKILWLFLHELVNFKTTDKKEDDLVITKLLKSAMKNNRKNPLIGL